ncbi:ABC transporter substrate-binding protein [Arthrobacter sp. 4R501]|uniref:ABC transporter substrate-binding protein n=1 Tax=Arthrobacter sp. 4R501 TaxID=2058886 RepID=UPI000CE4B14E|nr:extracellular solute-binding protein [Arthrobacter sp. 4R501]
MSVLKRSLSLAAGMACAAMALTGCGLSSGPESTVDTAGEINGSVRFQTMQLSPTFDTYIRETIAAFEAKHPGAKVEWTDIPSDAAARKVSADSISGALPDVMDLDTATLAPLGREGRVIDMATAASDIEGLYVPSAWNSFAFDATKVAGLPWYLNTPVLMSNKKILADSGLAGQTVPSSYQELLDVSRKIASATGKAGFQPTELGFPNYLLSLGVPLVNDDSTAAVVNTPEAVAFVTELAELYKSGGIPADAVTAKQRSEIATFQQGETAFLETGPSRLKIIQQNAPDVFSSIAVDNPLGEAAGKSWVVAHGLAVPKTSKQQATAVAFAKFMTSPDNQLSLAKQSSVFPSTSESLKDSFFTAPATDLPTESRAIAASSLLDGKTIAKPAAVDAEFATTLWSSLQPAILGEISPEAALAGAQERLTSILKERK